VSLQFRFGTAGIRAKVGERDDQLNAGTVRAIAIAIVQHLATLAPDACQRGVCLGFDGRADSRAFADEIEQVAVTRGFRVRRFDQVVPTPLLAFATRRSGAIGGIMVTASHNPAEDNGIKLYLAGGLQVGAPHDQEIAAKIAQGEPLTASTGGRVLPLHTSELTPYFDAIGALVPSRAMLPLPRLAYSATCGVGTATTRALFQRLSAHDVVEVAEQAEPQADFGGLASPNPEDPRALAKLLTLAEREQAAVAFAHDPDADRLAVLTRGEDGTLRALSGDEVGALLGSFLLEQHPSPERALLVSTHVSGGLLAQIAEAHGARFLRTPTGFKWIAQQGRQLAERAGLELLFGYEEAIGYAFFAMADDKDGIAALYVICELVRRLQAQGQTLGERLSELARAHGLFATRQLNVLAAGDDGKERIAAIMERLRKLEPAAVAGSKATLSDFESGPAPLPLLIFESPDGTRICVRPSGTEPKLKLYLHVREQVAFGEQVDTARARAELRLNTLAATLHRLALDVTGSNPGP
jgi:phosphomannomutase